MIIDIEAGAEGRPSAEARAVEQRGAGQPWLSILVPVYDVEPYVEECLHSILDQLGGDPGIELILLDDRSTDGSAALCERIIADSPANMRLMRHEANRGVSGARNSLLQAATGHYIWYVDPDDRMLPNAINGLRQIIDTAQPDMVLCDYVRSDNVAIPAFRGPAGQLLRYKESLIAGVFANRRMHLWTKICKRTLFDTIRFPDGAWFEDIATVPWLLLKAETFYYTAEPWIFYRSRPGSIIAQVARMRGEFNTRRYDDMAEALAGFRHDLRSTLLHIAPETEFFIGRFLAREYYKLFKRLIRARRQWANWHEARAELRRYREMMEENSPLSFTELVRQYVHRGHWGLALGLYMALTMSGGASGNHRPTPVRPRPA